MNLFSAVIFGAAAVSLAWGLRSVSHRYGKGAMTAGCVLCLFFVLTAVLAEKTYSSSVAANAAYLIALGGAAAYLGGEMREQQTLELTLSPDRGNRMRGSIGGMLKNFLWFHGAASWILLGLYYFVFGHTETYEMLLLVGGCIAARFLGIWMFNTPFEPEKSLFPKIYFGKDRSEVWGGCAMVTVLLVWYMIYRRLYLPLTVSLIAGCGAAVGSLAGLGLRKIAAAVVARRQGVNEQAALGQVRFLYECAVGFGGGFGALLSFALLFRKANVNWYYRALRPSGFASWGCLVLLTVLLLCFAFFEYRFAQPTHLTEDADKCKQANPLAALWSAGHIIWQNLCFAWLPMALIFIGGGRSALATAGLWPLAVLTIQLLREVRLRRCPGFYPVAVSVVLLCGIAVWVVLPASAVFILMPVNVITAWAVTACKEYFGAGKDKTEDSSRAPEFRLFLLKNGLFVLGIAAVVVAAVRLLI